MNVEVVVGVLLDSAEGLELRQEARRRPQPIEQAHAPNRVGAGEQEAQLGELALARRLARTPRLRAGERLGPFVDLEPQAGGDPSSAQDPQRVVGEATLGDGAQDPRLDIDQPVVRVERRRIGICQRDRDRVHREVAECQVRLHPVTVQHADVDVPGAVRRQGAPGGELGRQPEHRAAGQATDRVGRLPRITGDDQVEVPDVATEGRIADRAADDPVPLRGAEGLAGGQHGRSAGQVLCDRGAHRPSEPTCTRGTRGPIPQVIS